MKQRTINLRQILFDYDLVDDNQYLDQYLKLIDQDDSTEAGQYHHVIPVSYYQHKFKCKWTRGRTQANNLAAADKNNFLVKLSYIDHLLAHAYLALCSKPDWFKFSNANIITLAANKISPEEFINLSTEAKINLQKAYEQLIELKRQKTLSAEHKAKIANSHLRENLTADYRQKISEANHNRIWTTESKQKLSNSLKNSKAFQNKLISRNKINPPAKGSIWIHKGNLQTRVRPEDLDQYLESGWAKGRKKKEK